MPELSSKYFGRLQYSDDSVYEFPAGLPGFDEHVRFVFVEQPHTSPLVFMQSLLAPEVCFIAVPIQAADPSYRLDIAPEEREALGLDPSGPLPSEPQLLCLALVTVHSDSDPTANLAAPIVVNIVRRRGIQALHNWSAYPSAQPLSARSHEEIAC